jgi:hypothetical protein
MAAVAEPAAQRNTQDRAFRKRSVNEPLRRQLQAAT